MRNRSGRVNAFFLSFLLAALSLLGCGGSGSSSTTAPTISFTISNQTIGTAPFAVAATSNSSGAFSYSVISGPASISGSTVTLTGVGTVTIQASQAAAGNYSAATMDATFSIMAQAPSITVQPSNQTVTAPATATFSVTATGTAPLSYQWSMNGTMVSGANASTYTCLLYTSRCV